MIQMTCQYCNDYCDDPIICSCGKGWCSKECASKHRYLSRKKKSSCMFCRDDNDNWIYNLFSNKNES